MINKRWHFSPLLKKGKLLDTGNFWEVMTSVSAFCLVFVVLIGCGEPNLEDPKVREKVLAKAIDENILQTRRGSSGEELYYAPNKEKPYAGWVKTRRELYQLQSGKLNGFYISWYSNGQNSEKGAFKNSEKEGVWTEWYKNGQISEEGFYKNSKRDGNWVFWYENGQKSSEGSYKENQKDGVWAEWSKDGQKHDKGSYKENQKDGVWAAQYENGGKYSEGAYINGRKDGMWTEWYENGQKRSEGAYINGRKDGSWTEWYMDGHKRSDGDYVNGEQNGVWFTWYEGGKIHKVSFEEEEFSNLRLILSPDWKTVATFLNRTIDVWNVKTGQLLKQLKGHEFPVKRVMFAPDSKTLLSASYEQEILERTRSGSIYRYKHRGTYRLWDVETGKDLFIIPVTSDVLPELSSDGQTIAIDANYGKIRLLNANTGQTQKTLNFSARNLTFSPDGKTIASLGVFKRLSLLNVNTGGELEIEPHHGLSCLAFSPDGETIATGTYTSSHGFIYLWDVNTGKLRTTLYSHQVGKINNVVFSPDGKTIATSAMSTVYCWI